MDFDSALTVSLRKYGRETRESGRIGEELVECDVTMESLMAWVRKVAFEGGTVGTGTQPPRYFLKHQWIYMHQVATARSECD